MTEATARVGGGRRRDTCHLGHPIESRTYGQTTQRRCWTCARASARTRTRHRPGTSTLRDRARRYGLTASDYRALLEAQGNVCAICRQPCRTGQSLSVDHDHTTGRIRGLLCRTCNLGIGHLNDDPELVAAAAAYLRR